MGIEGKNKKKTRTERGITESMLDAMARNESLGSTASTRTQKAGLREVCSKCDGGSRAYPYAQQEAPQAAHADRPVHTGRSPIIRLLYDWYTTGMWYVTIIRLLYHYCATICGYSTTCIRPLHDCYSTVILRSQEAAQAAHADRPVHAGPVLRQLLRDYYPTIMRLP